MATNCQGCMTRTPYATLIATIMCMAGIGIFCGSVYRGLAFTRRMFEEIFGWRIDWLETVQLTFVVLGGCVGALGLLILFVGFLATGETRKSVYKAWQARVGGRISCAVFMTITYILQLAFLGMFCFLIVTTATFSLFWSLCNDKVPPYKDHNCIDFVQFTYLFPNNTHVDTLKICEHEMKLFCKDYVERAEAMFIIASIACGLVILSLIHYLMCLSANYAHIKDHEKLHEFQEIHYFATGESEMMALAGKDRY